VQYGYLIAGLVALALVMRDSSPGFSWFLANLVALHFLNFPATVLHELGHAVAAWTVGWPVRQVTIGWFGKPVFRRHLKGVVWEVRSIPLGGVTWTSPPRGGDTRWRTLVVYGAGPAANLLALSFIYLFGEPFQSLEDGLSLAGMFFWANALCVVIALYPKRTKSPNGACQTDGSVLLMTIFDWQELKRSFAIGALYIEALQLREKGLPEEALACIEKMPPDPAHTYALDNFRAILLLDAQKPAEAREVYLRLLKMSSQGVDHEAIVKNNLAWANFLIGDANLLAESLAATDSAMQKIGWMPMVRGTRGSILIQAGRAGEGLPMVKESFHSKENANLRDKAVNACTIALGEYELGHAEEGRRWAAVCRELDEKCPLLGRLAEIESKGR
jgi:hypothetical protein